MRLLEAIKNYDDYCKKELEHNIEQKHLDYLNSFEDVEIEVEENLCENAHKYAFDIKAMKYCSEKRTNHISDDIVLDWLVEYIQMKQEERSKYFKAPEKLSQDMLDAKEKNQSAAIEKIKNKSVELKEVAANDEHKHEDVEDGQISMFELLGV